MMNSTKQIIGNRGIHPQATAHQAASRTNRPPYAQTRSYNQGVYPGPSSYTDFPGMAVPSCLQSLRCSRSLP